MNSSHILVDGYSILYQWPELKSRLVKNLAAGRQALIQVLTQYHDCRGGKLTVVFDGRSLPKGGEAIKTSIGVVYSKDGQTADALIERIIGQSSRPGDYLVATDDFAEQNMVESLGGQTVSADAFHSMVESELQDLKSVLDHLTRKNWSFPRKK
jgi:uncharacterized protein